MLLSQFIPPSLSQTYSQMGSLSLGLNWESCSVISDSLLPHGIYSSWNSPGQNTGVGSHSLLQGIFPTQGSNPSLPHCRQVLYQLSYQESPRKLEWVGSLSLLQRIFLTQESKPGSPALQADSLPAELPGKPCCPANSFINIIFLHFIYIYMH